MNISEAEKYLTDLEMFGIKLGLDQVREFLSYLDSPQEKLKFIHVAGTNGKGSVSTMISQMLMETGFKVGLYTSPHLISVRERFQINGKDITAAKFAKMVAKLKPFSEKMRSAGRCPTYFEFTTVLAATYFAEEKVDFVLWETGMGGRFDATNIVEPICSVITNISLEHQQYLGDTIEKIALEKAGIIKPGKPVFCGKMLPEALEVIKAKTDELSCKLFFSKTKLKNKKIHIKRLSQSFQYKDLAVSLALPAPIQTENAKLAISVVEFLAAKFNFNLAKAVKGLKKVTMPGRMQDLPDGSIVDGAHNPAGTEVLLTFLKEYFPNQKFAVVFANFADKNTEEMLQQLAAVAKKFIFVPLIASSRRQSHSTEKLLQIYQQLNLNIPAVSADSVETIFKSKKPENLLYTGSLYLAGKVLELSDYR